MKDYREFDISDYAAQNLPGWRVRWGAEGANAVLLTSQEPGDKTAEGSWMLVYIAPDTEVTLDEESGKFTTNGRTVYYREYKLSPEEKKNPERIPSLILRRAYQDTVKGIAAPRYRHTTPLIPKDEAAALEKKFFDEIVAPCIGTHKIYAIDRSGTALCNRLDIPLDGVITVKHYSSATFQDEKLISVKGIPAVDDKPILVIDDMVSSGHTAAAVLYEFNAAGAYKVRYAALYNIIASREVRSVDSAIETTQNMSNFYWMYGRGMDLFDEQSRSKHNVYGASKSYAETMEDIDDLFHIFN